MKTREELAYCSEDCEECNIYRATVYGEELEPETVNEKKGVLESVKVFNSLKEVSSVDVSQAMFETVKIMLYITNRV